MYLVEPQNVRMPYSVVVKPPLPELTLVGGMKSEFYSRIGRYTSCRSDAHITICEFEASEKELIRIKAKLSSLCDSESPIDLHFDHLENYKSQTMFIAPSGESKRKLKILLDTVQESLHAIHKVGWGESSDPHMSIARGLNQEKSEIANAMFKTIDMSFCCDRIALRRLDKQVGQYKVIDEFLFNSKPRRAEGQLALF